MTQLFFNFTRDSVPTPHFIARISFNLSWHKKITTKSENKIFSRQITVLRGEKKKKKSIKKCLPSILCLIKNKQAKNYQSQERHREGEWSQFRLYAYRDQGSPVKWSPLTSFIRACFTQNPQHPISGSISYTVYVYIYKTLARWFTRESSHLRARS